MNRKVYYFIAPLIMVITLVVALVVQAVPTENTRAATITASGLTASDAKVTKDGKEVTGDTDRYQTYTVSYNWSIADSVDVQDGDTISFELPSNVQIVGETGINISIKNTAGAVVGNAVIKPGATSGTITITNAENLKRYSRTGTLEFEANGKTTYSSSDWMINKTGSTIESDNNGYVTWSIAYNPDSKKLSNVVLTDTMGTGQDYVDGSLKVQTGTFDKSNNNYFTSTGTTTAKVSQSGQVLTIDLGDISTGIYITYETKPNSEAGSKLTNSVTGPDGASVDAEVAWSGKGTATGVDGDKQETKGQVTLTKVSADDEKTTLSGATFELINQDTGKTVKENLVTDKNGQITVTDLAEGKYAFVETKAPEGYELDSDKTSFTINKDNTNVKVTVKDNKTPAQQETKGQVTLTKVSADDEKTTLSGATFELINQDTGKAVKENLVTDKNGQITVTDLAEGKYAFVETKAPEGYELNADKTSFTIAKDNINVKVTVKDNKTPAQPTGDDHTPITPVPDQTTPSKPSTPTTPSDQTETTPAKPSETTSSNNNSTYSNNINPKSPSAENDKTTNNSYKNTTLPHSITTTTIRSTAQPQSEDSDRTTIFNAKLPQTGESKEGILIQIGALIVMTGLMVASTIMRKRN